jgi:oligosaccharide repeat unit polymerase
MAGRLELALAAFNTGPYRLLVAATGTLGLLAAAMWAGSSAALTLAACAIGLAVLIGAYRFDYMHPGVAFVLPWLVVLFLSTVPISAYARPLQMHTSQILVAAVFIWLLATVSPPVFSREDRRRPRKSVAASDSRPVGPGIAIAFLVFYLLSVFNVVYAGYVPLFSLLISGNSGYFDFGIPSVYGAFLAYANTIGCLAFYMHLRTRRRSYLWLFLSVLGVHILFVTRQNILTLLVEALAIRCLVSRRFSRTAVILFMVAGLTAFSALGNLRIGGKIETIVSVRPEYSKVPTGVIWLYAYSYFNVLNLENMMDSSGAPLYDGSMWDGLLPSVLRPPSTHESYQELSSMSVTSYVFPVYMDIGPAGVMIWTAFWGLITAYCYRKALERGRFVDVATYACLYYCALFSFFVNFWLNLPVICQLVFFRVVHHLLVASDNPESDLPPGSEVAT